MKKFVTLMLVLMLAMSSVSAFACTGFYVGKDASANGTYMFGHTVDAWTSAQGNVIVVPRVENQPGRVYQKGTSGEFPLPDTTYKYTATPFIEGIYDGSVVNEMGVGISSATTCYITDEIRAMDPPTENGLSEQFMCELVGLCAATAREGVQVLADYIKMYGNAEQNCFVIADQNEAWYMETYTGYQWCAVKCPDDCVAVYGNNFMLQCVDPESEDVMYSEGMFSMPEEAGLAKYTEDGKFDIFATYSGDTLKDGNAMRTWYGHVLFAPSTVGDYESGKEYELFYKPDELITLNDVFDMTRSRYENTPFCPEDQEDYDYGTRVIAIERQINIGVVEIYDDLPAEMAGTTWVCNSEAEHGVYIPVNMLTEAVAEGYDYVPEVGGVDEKLAHYCFKRLNALSKQDRAWYGQGVRDYWNLIEEDLVASYPEVLAEAKALYDTDPQAAKDYMTEYTVGLQEKALEDANKIFDELMWYIISCTNTSKDPHSFDPFVPSMLAEAIEAAAADAAAMADAAEEAVAEDVAA